MTISKDREQRVFFPGCVLDPPARACLHVAGGCGSCGWNRRTEEQREAWRKMTGLQEVRAGVYGYKYPCWVV